MKIKNRLVEINEMLAAGMSPPAIAGALGMSEAFVEQSIALFAPKQPMTKVLTLVRGLPGSGKSTYAAAHLDDNTVHFEADQFMMLQGEYQFDPRLLGAAHDWCYANTVRTLRGGYNVFVTNTFTQMWELQRYLDITTIVDDVRIRVVEMKTQYQNIHGVPVRKLEIMAARWQEMDPTLIEQYSLEVVQVK